MEQGRSVSGQCKWRDIIMPRQQLFSARQLVNSRYYSNSHTLVQLVV